MSAIPLDELTPWQHQVLEALAGGSFPVAPDLACGARRNGRAVELLTALGVHLHVAGADGAWCVTWQPIGFLWARLPGSGPAACYYAEDEDMSLAGEARRRRRRRRRRASGY